MTTIRKTSDLGLFLKILRSYACVVFAALCVAGFALQLSGVRDRYHDCKNDATVLSSVCDGRFRFVWWSVYFELIVIVSICLASSIGLHLHIKHSALAFISVSTTQLILGVDRFVGEQISPGEKTAAVGFVLSVLGNFLLIFVVGAPDDSISNTSEEPVKKPLEDSDKEFVSVEESEKEEEENLPPEEEPSTLQSGALTSEQGTVKIEEESSEEDVLPVEEEILPAEEEVLPSEEKDLLPKPETLQAELDAELSEMETLKMEEEILKSDQMDVIFGGVESTQEQPGLNTIAEEPEISTTEQPDMISLKGHPKSEQENRSTEQSPTQFEQELSALEEKKVLKAEQREIIPEVKNVVFERHEEDARIKSAAASTSYSVSADEIQVAHSDDSS